MPDGSVLLMGGYDTAGGYKNDVWPSRDKDVTWARVTDNAPWQQRFDHTMTVLSGDSIVLVGGCTYEGTPLPSCPRKAVFTGNQF